MGGEGWIVVSVAALTLGAVCSTLAQSLRDLSRTALEEIAVIKNRPVKTARVKAILEDVEGHAVAISLPRVASSLLVVLGLVLAATDIRGLSHPTWIEVTGSLVIASLVIWFFASVLPSAIAKHAGESTVYAWAGMLRAAYVVTTPLRALARSVDEGVRKLSGKTPEDEVEAIQEEILSAVDEAREEGQFDQAERDMIEGVVRFRDKTVAQIMTSRTEMEAMEVTANLGAVTAAVRKIKHSRIPVYEDDLDHIVGIFYVKDLMRWLAGEGRHGKTFDLKDLLRPAIFVPESKSIRELLRELLKKRVHIAIVADEYGGTAGLVTMEDIVEEVFGEIQDEYESPKGDVPEIKVDAEGKAAELDARAYIEDANAAIESLNLEIPESEDYDTVGGFVTVSLGRIPRAGEQFQHGGLRIMVLAAEPTRVTRVRLEPAPTAGTQADAAGAGSERGK